jgi:hypothetical protein
MPTTLRTNRVGRCSYITPPIQKALCYILIEQPVPEPHRVVAKDFGITARNRAHILALYNNRTREKRKFETVAEAVQARHLILNSRPDSSRKYTSTLQSYLTKRRLQISKLYIQAIMPSQ